MQQMWERSQLQPMQQNAQPVVQEEEPQMEEEEKTQPAIELASQTVHQA